MWTEYSTEEMEELHRLVIGISANYHIKSLLLNMYSTFDILTLNVAFICCQSKQQR